MPLEGVFDNFYEFKTVGEEILSPSFFCAISYGFRFPIVHQELK